MDSRQLSYFRAVVDHGSFTNAAEALGMTQPSLSLSIRKLETELDVTLLTRGRAGVATTEAGTVLYKIAVQIDGLMEEAKSRINEISHGVVGKISICSAPEFNWALMPRVLHKMNEFAPDVRIFLEDPNPSVTLERVLDGTVDLGLLPCTDPESFIRRFERDLEITVAAEMKFFAAIPQRLSDLPDPVSLQDLTDQAWLLPPHHTEFDGLPELLAKAWEDNPEAKPKRIQEIATLQTAIPLISGGLGVSLLPDAAKMLTSKDIHYREISEDIPPLNALLIRRRDRELSPAAKQLIDLVLRFGGIADPDSQF